MKYAIDKYLYQLESYIYDLYGILVFFDEDSEDAYYHNTNQIDEDDFITINTSQPKLHQLYSLLHEAGHLALRHQESKYALRFIQDPNYSKIDTLREEVLAWDLAQDIAMLLNIEIDIKSFSDQRADALTKYAFWCVLKD